MYRHNIIERFVPRQEITPSKEIRQDDSQTKAENVNVQSDKVPLVDSVAFNRLMIEQLGEPFIDVDPVKNWEGIVAVLEKVCCAE